MVNKMRGLVCAALVAMGAWGLGGGTAAASDYCPPPCRYEWKVCYETVKVPYTKVVTLYDHCGCPYQVTVTCYRYVQVPVKKLVKVCY